MAAVEPRLTTGDLNGAAAGFPAGSASSRSAPFRLGGVGTFVLDGHGRVTGWAPSAGNLLGHDASDAVGRHVADLLPPPSDGRDLVSTAVADAAAGRPWLGRISVAAPDGFVHEVELRCEPLAGHQPPAVLATATYTAAQASENLLDSVGSLTLINEANLRIGSTLDLTTTARELMAVAVPRFADVASILVLQSLVNEDALPDLVPDGSAAVQRMAVGISGPNAADWEAAYPVDEVSVYPAWTLFARCMASGKPVLQQDTDLETAAAIAGVWGRREITDLVRHVSLVAVPLTARGTVLGFVVYAREPGRRPFDDVEVSLAVEVGARAALCIDNARLFSRERRTALTLQSSLLPQTVLSPIGLEVAHRYAPASDMTGVGGDWFDVIPLPGRRVGLVIGDVMGHGTRAAATMGQLRTAVRTLASLDLPPDVVLRRLDDMIRDLDPTQIATSVYLTYDPVAHRCAVSRAGHIPPILVTPEGTTEIMDSPAGLPLGIGGETFVTTEFTIAPGSIIVLCTDGLVESRDDDIDHGITALRRRLTEPHASLKELCDATVGTLARGHHRDDIALMLARTYELTDDQHVAWTFPGEPRTAGEARRLVRETLVSWDLPSLGDTAELLTSELVTNAYRHAGGPIDVRVLRGRSLLCEVSDPLPVRPHMRETSPADESGRGLELVHQLAARWGTRFTDTGKVVWYELNLPS